MDKIVLVATKPPKARRDDDFVDRLSSRYTVMLLIAFAAIISITQWVGKPMQCWVPKHFTGSHTKYANSFCWVNNTYFLPFGEHIPYEHEHDKRHMIKYYQWIPWILLSQAFFFWLPSLLWHGLNSKAGVDSDDILASANTLQDTKLAEKRETRLNLLGNQLDRFLGARHNEIAQIKQCCACCLSFLLCRCCGRRNSSYLIGVYILSKVFYLINVLCQMFALNGLLNTDFQSFGPDYVNFYHGNGTQTPGEFLNSIIFPRVTMCDFKIRILGNQQRYTVQCVLPLNLYLEKMYLIFWFWLLILLALTAADLVIWFLRTIIRGDRLNFILNHLHAGRHIKSTKDEDLAEDFLDDYLRQDGAFLLRMIAHNTNAITAADVCGKLFDNFKERAKKRRDIAATEMEELDPAGKPVSDQADKLPEKSENLYSETPGAGGGPLPV